jgi:hypothetical protein
MCNGPCNNRYRRARAIYQVATEAHAKQAAAFAEAGKPVPDPPREPSIQPEWGAPIWCAACAARIRAALDGLGDLGSMLAAMPPEVHPAVDWPREQLKVAGTRAAPSPSPSGDTLEEFEAWLAGWEALAKGDTYRPRRGAMARHNMVCVLIDFSAVLLARRDRPGDDDPPDGQLFGEQVWAWHRYLADATHSDRPARHVNKRCPGKGCDRYTLWEKPGEEYIICVNPACNARLTREELAGVA